MIRCTIDFEKGMWKAVRELFPGILVKGCFFHYAQACMRHIEEEGLKKAYCSNDATHKLLKKCIVLPLMHHEDIPCIFMELKSKVGANSPLLSNFFQYVEINWIASTTWPPINWSVFGCSIRTNNDVEGWHNKINKRVGKSNLSFYKCSEELYKEALDIPAMCKALQEQKIRRRARCAARDIKLFEAWDRYNNKQCTTHDLLNDTTQPQKT